MKGGFEMSKIVVSCFLSTLCVVVAAGCGTVVERELGWDASPEYTVLTQQQLEDIPAPDGFEVDRASKQTFSYAPAGSSFRAARFVYYGRDSVNSVVRFYKRTMLLPTYGWQLENTQKVKDAVEMRFAKGREICTVVVRQNKGSSIKRTRVDVDLKGTP